MTSRQGRVGRDEMPDAELLRELYVRHGGAVLAYLRRLGVARQDAEDVMRETMLRARRQAETLDPATDAMRGWLYAVARDVLMDRAHSCAANGGDPSLAGAQAGQAAPADHRAVADRVVVLDALARLSPERRVVLVEVYYRGRPVDAVAADLGLPSAAVRTRLHEAMRDLRSITRPGM